MKSLLTLLVVLLTTGIALGDTIRVATFNASLNRKGPGLLIRDLERGKNRQIKAVQDIILIVRPDILLINEFDHDHDGIALRLFQQGLSDQGLVFSHSFAGPSNTGEPSGIDLNGDGKISIPGDAYGYGNFRGQYGMALLSRYPIGNLRSFRKLKWRDAPNAVLPKTRDGGPYPNESAQSEMRLSSKSHWDAEILTPSGPLHLFASHPTPPVFDGPEDANGLRNASEVLFWQAYLKGTSLPDDTGNAAPFNAAHFVIAGDLNVDPFDGDGRHDAINSLLQHPAIQDPKPASLGGVEATEQQKGVNTRHQGDPALDTSDWRDDRGPGNLRVDYVLPSANLRVVDAGVFWPKQENPLFKLIGPKKPISSDHRLVWVDIQF